MNKIDTYLKRYAQDIRISLRSRYYKVGENLTIRVSDHFASNSDGTFGFICTRDDDKLIFYRKSSGQCSVLNYREAKEMVRSLVRMPDLLLGVAPLKSSAAIDPNDFTEGQLKQIRLYQKQNKKHNK